MITPADIKRVRNRLGLNQSDFGSLMGVGQNSISDYETGKAIPSKTFIEYFKYRYIDNSSLSTVDPQSKVGFTKDKNIEKSFKKTAVKNSDDLNYLLEMTQEILISNTDYADSLAANIKSFHKSVINEKRLNKMEARMTAFENATTRKISALEKELSENRKKKDRRKNEEPYNGEERRTGLADRRISNKL